MSLNPFWAVSPLDQRVGRHLDESAGAAYVDERLRVGGPGDLVERLAVDPSAVASPPFRPFPCEGEANINLVVGGEAQQLVAIEDVHE
jgi:hypothetical protein